jgi:hypothetical protein
MTFPNSAPGNVYSQVYGAARQQRSPILSLLVQSPTTVAASSTLVVGSIVIPSEPGRVKGVIRGARWLQGSVAGTLGSGITVNILNVTNANKNCGARALDAAAIAVGAATASGTITLAATTTDRSATFGASGTTPASPPATSTEPDVSFFAGDQLAVQIVTAAGASATAGALQLDYQWLDDM